MVSAALEAETKSLHVSMREERLERRKEACWRFWDFKGMAKA